MDTRVNGSALGQWAVAVVTFALGAALNLSGARNQALAQVLLAVAAICTFIALARLDWINVLAPIRKTLALLGIATSLGLLWWLAAIRVFIPPVRTVPTEVASEVPKTMKVQGITERRQSIPVAPTPALSALGMRVSRDEIDEILRNLPPLQRDEAARLYKGVRIQWAGELRGMYRSQEDRIVVYLTCRNSVVVMSDTLAVVPYAREVFLLPEGVKVKVAGTISEIEPGRNGPVWLDPAEVSLQAP
jgi:hypothetical protein